VGEPGSGFTAVPPLAAIWGNGKGTKPELL